MKHIKLSREEIQLPVGPGNSGWFVTKGEWGQKRKQQYPDAPVRVYVEVWKETRPGYWTMDYTKSSPGMGAAYPLDENMRSYAMLFDRTETWEE